MNPLTVISVAALVASGSTTLLAYNGVYGGHHGLLGAYPYAGYSGLLPYAYTGALPAAAPLTLKTPVINTVAPAPVSYNVAPAPVSYNVAPAPVSYNVAPVAPVAPIQSQYHAQDEIGQYSFGYAGGPSSRAESRDAFGVVRGSYNYVDSEGKVQTQHYVADALGFRVSAPTCPGPRHFCGSGSSPTRLRPSSAAAAEAAPDTRKKRSVLGAAPGLGVQSPLRFSYSFSAPLHYGLPAYAFSLHYTAAHPALTTYNAAPVPTTYAATTGPALRCRALRVVLHPPAHATSYRVLTEYNPVIVICGV
ncbi:uncharacterized protein LOC122260071 [Penaeus japonicus]|uniref:uncharacterized protein LOC122260071 n=1 Tax=Penaeus japonicus TaxID=27405 RepID=UPI001C70D7E0|nr:uncharacterized protein LOC122260071 [Penaeus japonicus]